MDPFQVAQHSVVMVVVSSRGKPVGSGSGVIVTDRRHVVTNFHVAVAGDAYEVVLAPPGSPRVSTTATLVDYDEIRDLAILRLKQEIGSPVQVAAGPPSLGDPLVIAGYPGVGGDTLTVTKGAVSGFLDQRDGLGDAWIKTDTTINHGNSGGAALDAVGRLVGIPTFLIRDGGDSLGYVLSIQEGRGFISSGVARAEARPLPARARPVVALAPVATPSDTPPAPRPAPPTMTPTPAAKPPTPSTPQASPVATLPPRPTAPLFQQGGNASWRWSVRLPSTNTTGAPYFLTVVALDGQGRELLSQVFLVVADGKLRFPGGGVAISTTSVSGGTSPALTLTRQEGTAGTARVQVLNISAHPEVSVSTPPDRMPWDLFIEIQLP